MARIVFSGLIFAAIALAEVTVVAHYTGLAAPACSAPTVAVSSASPISSATEDGDATLATPADPATTARVIAGIENFVACRNAGDYAAYAALLTPDRMIAEAGTTNPADVVAGLEAFNLPITILSLGDVRTYSDGRLSAEFVHLFGDHLYYRSRIFVIEEDGYIKFDEEIYLPEEPQGVQEVVEVGLDDFAFQLDQDVVNNAQYVVLRGHNEGSVPHEIIVVRLPAGTTAEQAIAGEVDESQIDFIGQVEIAPGESDDLVLTNLEPGQYTLLCFLDEPDGVPHAALGMIGQLTVEGMSTPIAVLH